MKGIKLIRIVLISFVLVTTLYAGDWEDAPRPTDYAVTEGFKGKPLGIYLQISTWNQDNKSYIGANFGAKNLPLL